MCIDSLTRHMDGLKWFLVVVDDGSTDGTTKWLMEHHENQPIPFYVCYHHENRGFTKAINTGIRKAIEYNPDYICIINNDLLFFDKWSVALIDFLEKSGYDIASPLFTLKDHVPERWTTEDGLRWARKYKNVFTVATPRGIEIVYMKHEFEYHFIPQIMLGSCLVIKTQVFKDIGLFDETFTTFWSDEEFKFRALSEGKKIAQVYESHVHHFGSKTCKNKKYTHLDKVLQEDTAKFILRYPFMKDYIRTQLPEGYAGRKWFN
jgi:GT2 family glycosyltransferase